MGYSYYTTTIPLLSPLPRPLSSIIRAMQDFAGIAWGGLAPFPKKPKDIFLKFCLLLVAMSSCSTPSRPTETRQPLTFLSETPLPTCMGIIQETQVYYGAPSCKLLRQINSAGRRTIVLTCQRSVQYWEISDYPLSVSAKVCDVVKRQCTLSRSQKYFTFYQFAAETCSL